MRTAAAPTCSLADFCGTPAPAGIVLLYHRVAELPTDPQQLCVRPAHFAQHLAVLRDAPERLEPTPLCRVNRAPGQRTRVALTFDDGYADNLYHALPLLERYQVPATVFVVTGSAGRAREFWWDELERLLLWPNHLPVSLRLVIAGREHTWALGTAADYGWEDFDRWRRWQVGQAPPTPRHVAYLELHRLLRPLDEPARNAVLDVLKKVAGDTGAVRPTHRALGPDALRTLAESPWVELGAHTVTHPVLAGLPADVARREIADSRKQLEGVLRRRVSLFSYPFGGRRDYTGETVELVRRAGFTQACANFEGVCGEEVDSYQLPRFIVRDWDGETFRRRLREWLS